MKHFSLFSGIGGFKYGIEKAVKSKIYKEGNMPNINKREVSHLFSNTTCIGYSEINKYAEAIYKFHYSEQENYGDATRIIPEELPNFNLLCAGFPCQAFSIAGKRKGFNDTRGTLFFEICRIARAKKPNYLLLENVRGLLSHDEGCTFLVILQSLDELGYDLQWQVLNSKDWGVPQNRERVFIIGNLRGKSRPEVFPIKEASKNIIKYYQGDISGKEYQSQQDRIYPQQGIMGILPTTRTENKCHLLQEDMQIRRLTPTECERLQGFPDNWTKWGIMDGKKVEISDTQRYKCLGNAVTTNVIQAIMERWMVSNNFDT